MSESECCITPLHDRLNELAEQFDEKANSEMSDCNSAIAHDLREAARIIKKHAIIDNMTSEEWKNLILQWLQRV